MIMNLTEAIIEGKKKFLRLRGEKAGVRIEGVILLEEYWELLFSYKEEEKRKKVKIKIKEYEKDGRK